MRGVRLTSSCLHGVILFVSVVVCQPAVAFDCPQHFWQGVPPIVTRPALLDSSLELCHAGQATLYSAKSRTPLWSAEYLDRSRLAAAATLSRTNDFHEDELVPVESRSTLADYRGSGFDRGHLAPNGDMGTRDQQFDSFALSNIVPQNRIHNQGVWRKLEEATRALVKQRDAAYVVTGVVFETDTLSMAGSVLVPTALYKAVYFPGQQQAGAYWSPNDARGQVTVLSLTELEHRTGIVVMPGIGKTIRDRAMSLPLDARSPRSIVRESGQQDTLRRIPNDPFYWPARDALLYLLRKLKMMVD